MEFLDLEEGSGETGEIQNLCVVGKVFSHKACHVTAVSNVCNVAWKTRAALVADIKEWALNKNWIFIWASREQNSAAHWLATRNLDDRFNCSSGCIPPELVKLLVVDCTP